jgi:hypothetical protein
MQKNKLALAVMLALLVIGVMSVQSLWAQPPAALDVSVTLNWNGFSTHNVHVRVVQCDELGNELSSTNLSTAAFTLWWGEIAYDEECAYILLRWDMHDWVGWPNSWNDDDNQQNEGPDFTIDPAPAELDFSATAH